MSLWHNVRLGFCSVGLHRWLWTDRSGLTMGYRCADCGKTRRRSLL
jgi:hypothetical protein